MGGQAAESKERGPNMPDTSERSARVCAHGRTELAGNHVDHQGGRVMSATVDCGITMELAPNGTDTVRLQSEGFAPMELDVRDTEPVASERNTTAALVRGVVAGMRAAGVPVSGFDARAASDIPAGGGLSSSAAFEIAVARGIDALFGDGAIGPLALARIGCAAEREWFGKPCGLQDQTAIALGGISLMDFAPSFSGGDVAHRPISFDFEEHGFALCLIDTHCDHSLYPDDFAQVTEDMLDVARFLGAEVLEQAGEDALMARFEDVRAQLGDGPALRALHYFNEVRLVDERVRALEAGDMEAFLAATRRSGFSSAAILQNVATADRRSQPASVALALAARALDGRGAYRIHGGGFGGTVQAFVPLDALEGFAAFMDGHLGEGSCRRYRIVSE